MTSHLNWERKNWRNYGLLGNYHHNIQVLETRCGHLLVMRRPSDFEETKPEDFLPCSYCFGFIRKNELWRHCKTCAFKDNNDVEDENSEQKYKNIQQKSKILLMAHLKPSESRLLQEVVASMKSDEVTMAATNDELIMKYGANTVEKLGGDRLHEVSQGLRQLSRPIRLAKSSNFFMCILNCVILLAIREEWHCINDKMSHRYSTENQMKRNIIIMIRSLSLEPATSPCSCLGVSIQF